MTTYSIGIKNSPTVDAMAIPAKTAMPMLTRAAAPAPLAITSGTTPRMNAKAVIMMGRKRSLAPSAAASNRPMPFLS